MKCNFSQQELELSRARFKFSFSKINYSIMRAKPIYSNSVLNKPSNSSDNKSPAFTCWEILQAFSPMHLKNSHLKWLFHSIWDGRASGSGLTHIRGHWHNLGSHLMTRASHEQVSLLQDVSGIVIFSRSDQTGFSYIVKRPAPPVLLSVSCQTQSLW